MAALAYLQAQGDPNASVRVINNRLNESIKQRQFGGFQTAVA